MDRATADLAEADDDLRDLYGSGGAAAGELDPDTAGVDDDARPI